MDERSAASPTSIAPSKAQANASQRRRARESLASLKLLACVLAYFAKISANGTQLAATLRTRIAGA